MISWARDNGNCSGRNENRKQEIRELGINLCEGPKLYPIYGEILGVGRNNSADFSDHMR